MWTCPCFPTLSKVIGAVGVQTDGYICTPADYVLGIVVAVGITENGENRNIKR